MLSDTLLCTDTAPSVFDSLLELEGLVDMLLPLVRLVLLLVCLSEGELLSLVLAPTTKLPARVNGHIRGQRSEVRGHRYV